MSYKKINLLKKVISEFLKFHGRGKSEGHQCLREDVPEERVALKRGFGFGFLVLLGRVWIDN